MRKVLIRKATNNAPSITAPHSRKLFRVFFLGSSFSISVTEPRNSSSGYGLSEDEIGGLDPSFSKSMFARSSSGGPAEVPAGPSVLSSRSLGENSGEFSIDRSTALATTSSTHCSESAPLSSFSTTKSQVSRDKQYKSHHEFCLYLLVIASATCLTKSAGICSGASTISAVGERRRRRRFSQAMPVTTSLTSISPFSF